MSEPGQPNYGPYGSGSGNSNGGYGGEFGQPVADAQPGEFPPPPPPPQQPPYGTGQWQYGTQTGYQQPYYGYGFPQTPGTNGLAVAAMVCGLCGFLCLIPGIVGVILGAVSLPQIKRSGQSGRGMAITGIVAGAVWIIGFVLLIVLSHTGGDPTF
ncbi:DUF4190 domain-containing protein [Actinospica robiniae]|uniref:DUF4190 domain-containing protein n=1 Tax=Actinospica robiniae TaxID=304901 RepID=UPI00041A8BDF|nr:DUF4190 domain-containing protein [Actinospica robiniae]